MRETALLLELTTLEIATVALEMARDAQGTLGKMQLTHSEGRVLPISSTMEGRKRL